MLRIKDIQDALLNLVGWQQHYDLSKHIDTKLTRTESGLTYQGAHPLLTLENIEACMPEDYIKRYAPWYEGLTYEKGDKVVYQAKCVIATRNTSAKPFDANTDWQLYNIVSDYIEDLTRQGIATMVQQFITDKQLSKETHSLLEHRTFFDGSANINAYNDRKGKLVGFEINPVRSMGVTTKINRIGLQMRGATGNVTLYLFHSSQVEPVKTITLEYTNESGMFQWFDIEDCYLPYKGADTDAGGSWYLLYNQNDLPEYMKALNVSKDWSREPCGTCNIGSVQAWRELTKYLQVSPFCTTAPADFADNPQLFDNSHLTYTNTNNHGLNCEISVECDLTDTIITQRHIFANALQKQVAVNVLRMMAMNPSTRINRNQANMGYNEILFEIEGNTAGREGGLGSELKKAYKALALDTKGLDRICLTCNNGGVNYTTI